MTDALACKWCGGPSREPDYAERLPGRFVRICDACNLVFSPDAPSELYPQARPDGLVGIWEYGATDEGRNDPHLPERFKSPPDAPPRGEPVDEELKRAIAEHYAAWGFAAVREENWPHVIGWAKRQGATVEKLDRSRPRGDASRNVGDLHHVGNYIDRNMPAANARRANAPGTKGGDDGYDALRRAAIE